MSLVGKAQMEVSQQLGHIIRVPDSSHHSIALSLCIGFLLRLIQRWLLQFHFQHEHIQGRRNALVSSCGSILEMMNLSQETLNTLPLMCHTPELGYLPISNWRLLSKYLASPSNVASTILGILKYDSIKPNKSLAFVEFIFWLGKLKTHKLSTCTMSDYDKFYAKKHNRVREKEWIHHMGRNFRLGRQIGVSEEMTFIRDLSELRERTIWIPKESYF